MRNAILFYLGPPREFWMIYRGPGFLAVVWFGYSHISFSPSPARKLSLFPESSCVSLDEVTDGRGGGQEAESYEPRKSLVFYKPFNTLWFPPPPPPASKWGQAWRRRKTKRERERRRSHCLCLSCRDRGWEGSKIIREKTLYASSYIFPWR
jgi:hypothetical protein